MKTSKMFLMFALGITPQITLAEDPRIQELISQKQAKMQRLEKCQGTTKGLKIAGLSMLGITAVGVGVNIGEASKIKQNERAINTKDAEIASLKEEIAKKKREEEERKRIEAEEERKRIAQQQSRQNETRPQPDNKNNGNQQSVVQDKRCNTVCDANSDDKYVACVENNTVGYYYCKDAKWETVSITADMLINHCPDNTAPTGWIPLMDIKTDEWKNIVLYAKDVDAVSIKYIKGYLDDAVLCMACAPGYVPAKHGYDCVDEKTAKCNEILEEGVPDDSKHLRWEPIVKDGRTMNENFGDKSTSGGLSAGEWAVTFSTGEVRGRALCSSTNGSEEQPGNPNETDSGEYCWCKITNNNIPECSGGVSPSWVLLDSFISSSYCKDVCASSCAIHVSLGYGFTGAMFGLE